MGEIKVDGYRCERCSHIWISRNGRTESPVVCPRCKSPYWNKPKILKRGGKKNG
jgi:predicted Zn-ribbon and HTH transcriptional regulator